MTEERRAKKQSKLLGELGLIPSGGDWVGQPLFQFKRASDLKIVRRNPRNLIQSSSGLWVPTAQEWEWIHQTAPNDNRWCIAQWREPAYTPDKWAEEFGFLLAYPRNGWWWLFLPLNYLPDEEWTQWWVKYMIEQKQMTPQERMNQTISYYEGRKAKDDALISEMAKAEMVNHVPGLRGGIVSYPYTKLDRNR